MESDQLLLLEKIAVRCGIATANMAAPVAHRFTSRDGLTLSCLDWGGSGPAVVFLHGGALTAHTWDLVCLGLRQDYRCIALDLRGHGNSDWAEDYRIETAVGDIDALASHLSLRTFHVVGMSLGGTIGAHYAGAFASRVLSLTLVDVGPGVNFSATANLRNFVANTQGVDTIQAAIDVALAVNPRGDRDKVTYRLMHSMRRRSDGRFGWKLDQRRPRDYPHILDKLEEIPQLAQHIQCPVLTVRGGRSKIFGEQAAAACAALFARGRLVTVPDAGHSVQEDNPAGLIAALRSFF